MSKTYLLLISGLIILVLAVGSYAFYKSSNASVPLAPNISLNQNPKSPTLPTQTPAASPKANQIPLTIISPKDGAQLTGPSVQVTGKTAANADVSVNDRELKADAGGNFTATVALDEGDNYLSVTAVDSAGNVAEQEITVTYTPNQ